MHNLDAALTALAEFTRTTGLIISGCECCGSAFFEDGDTLVLDWNDRTNTYEIRT